MYQMISFERVRVQESMLISCNVFLCMIVCGIILQWAITLFFSVQLNNLMPTSHLFK